MNSSRRPFAHVGLPFLITLAAVALLVGDRAARAQAPKADLSFIDRGDIGTLDPNRASWMQDIRVASALWEGLYMNSATTFEPELAAAEKVELSDDKTVWTFHLRENAKWSNGDPLVSADFTFAWKRMLDEPGDYTYLIDQYVKGAKEYEDAFADYLAKRGSGAQATPPDFKTVGMEALDTATVRITLKHPVSFFPDLCAFPCYFPLNERAMKGFREVDPKTERVTYNAAWATPPNLVTNGAYKLTKWQLRVGMWLEQNEFYWDRANVKNKSVQVVVVDEPLTGYRKFMSGEVDLLTEVTADIAADMVKAGQKEIHIVPSFGTYFYSFNCSEKLPDGRVNPFADKRVRQALTMAIDKKPIVQNITKCGEAVTDLYVPPDVFNGYAQAPGLAYDVKAARKLMNEAGFPGGKGFPNVKLTFNTESPEHKLIAEYVTNQWQKNLNVKIELEGVEIKQFQQRLHNKDYDVARASWYGDYMDISTFTDKYLSWSLNNDSNWKNPQYDQLCKDAAPEADPKKRYELLSQAEGILNQEVPILPLYSYVNKLAYRDNVKGLVPNPRNIIVLKAISAR